MTTYNRSQILMDITKAFEENDLSFLETINNITFGYKNQLKNKFTKTNGKFYDQSSKRTVGV